MQAEYPIWRLVLETPNSLQEVDSWGLGRVYDALEILEMKNSFEGVAHAQQAKEVDDRIKDK